MDIQAGELTSFAPAIPNLDIFHHIVIVRGANNHL